MIRFLHFLKVICPLFAAGAYPLCYFALQLTSDLAKTPLSKTSSYVSDHCPDRLTTGHAAAANVEAS